MMSIYMSYYFSISYHVVNLRLKKGLHKMLQNHSSMMLFLYFTYWYQMKPYIFQSRDIDTTPKMKTCAKSHKISQA